MNQQRARRFRSAMDAKENAEKALKKGTVLPTEAAFDSNCITPGTPFMMRLQKQLEYFISKKISQDSKWKSVKVILSGHDVPGLKY
jgi:5'-3' exoribonuclease 1